MYSSRLSIIPSARHPCRLSVEIALCTIKAPFRGTPKCFRREASRINSGDRILAEAIRWDSRGFQSLLSRRVATILPPRARTLSSVRLLYSQTYWGKPQKCTGRDQLMLARAPWEDEAILIRGVALTHRVYPPTDDAFAMAGSSAVDGDILAHVSGSGTAQIMYPEGTGFLFPGRAESCHIDVHAWCNTGKTHDVWLTVFYHKPVETGLLPLAIPQPENDRLSELARLNPGYAPVPPDPPTLLGTGLGRRIGRVASLLRRNQNKPRDS